VFEKIGEDEVKEPEEVPEEEKVAQEIPLPAIPESPPQSSAEDETQ
jgi:hypothetical protein